MGNAASPLRSSPVRLALRKDASALPPIGEGMYSAPSFGFSTSGYLDDDGSCEASRETENPNALLYRERDSVPLLPLPTLEHSLELLLSSCKALATSEQELEETRALIQAMLLPDSNLRHVHAKLLDLKHQCDLKRMSWFIAFWNKHAYLECRDSVAHNVSYHLLLQDESAQRMRVPIRRAARFLCHAIRYRNAVVTGQLPPDRDPKTGAALDNSQHKFLFHTCRIPGRTRDVARLFDAQRFPTICVARNGRFFLLPLGNGSLMPSVGEIYAQLEQICQMAANDSANDGGTGVGYLTSQQRDAWYADREELLKNKTNAKALFEIESAAFLLCLDGSTPKSRNSVAVHMLNANADDAANRFWDKSSQIISSDNGKIAYVAEHSMCDGVTTARFVNEILEAMSKEEEESVEGTATLRQALSVVREIRFKLSTATKRSIARARAAFVRQMHDTESEVFVHTKYGSETIKSEFKLSPDAFAQMAMQCAGRQVFGRYVGTYESTQTRTFVQGRTEVTRVVSEDSRRFCDALLFESHGKQDVQLLLQRACKTHSEYVQMALRGHGCDRHLLALKLLHDLGSSGEKLALFENELVKRSGRWEISTSALVGERIDGWSFGEVVPTGVGVAYSVMRDSIRFTVTSSTKNKGKLAHRFVQALETSLQRMQDLYVE